MVSNSDEKTMSVTKETYFVTANINVIANINALPVKYFRCCHSTKVLHCSHFDSISHIAISAHDLKCNLGKHKEAMSHLRMIRKQQNNNKFWYDFLLLFFFILALDGTTKKNNYFTAQLFLIFILKMFFLGSILFPT